MDEELSEEMSAVCNLAEGIARKNRAQGMAQGMAQGEQRLGTLMSRMREAGRIEDAFRAATDPAYREAQYKFYNIGQETAQQA